MTQFERGLMGGFWASQDYWGFLNTFKYDDSKVVLDKYAIVEASRTRLIYNWLQYFALDSLTHDLDQCGLRVVESYADVAGAKYTKDSNMIAIVAQKT